VFTPPSSTRNQNLDTFSFQIVHSLPPSRAEVG
jgi:hypothetical protein